MFSFWIDVLTTAICIAAEDKEKGRMDACDLEVVVDCGLAECGIFAGGNSAVDLVR